MKALIKVNGLGYRHSYEQEGEVVKLCETVERFDDKWLQVPALVLKSDAGLWVVPLTRQGYDIEVDYIAKEE